MNEKLYLFIVGWISLSINAQVIFNEHIIDPSLVLPMDIKSADIDGDSDLDIIAATRGNWDIAWYENLDGQGNYGDKQGISAQFPSDAYELHAIDLDGDDDLDILTFNTMYDTVYWFENIDGLGNFGSEQIIYQNPDPWPIFILSTFASDLDGDGDLDVLTASSIDNKIAWYVNDGSGTFGSQQIISLNADGACSIFSCDLDNDGDMDVLSASTADHKIAWYENDGQGSFGNQRIISTAVMRPNNVYACDLDNDGDLDIISTSTDDNKIAWYKNEGVGVFGPQQIISSDIGVPNAVYSCDLDNDGDLDVLTASSEDNKIAWFVNDGEGNFGSELIIALDQEAATSVYAGDVDDDGDIDVLSARPNAYKIAWYENLGPLGTENHSAFRFSFYPVPTSAILNINSKSRISRIVIYNLLGQLVASNEYQNSIDLSALTSGVYFCKVMDDNGNIGTKKVVKR